MKDIGLISDKLDFTISISLSLSQEMGLFFSKIEDAIPLYASLNADSAEISLFLGEEMRKKYDPSFGKFTQTSRGKFDILNFKADELMFEFQVFKDIMKIPSVVPGGFYLKEGWVHADFRFHHSSLQRITELIRKIAEAKNKIHLSRLSSSMGLEETLKGICSRIPITNVSFVYTPEPGYMPDEVLQSEPIVEVKLYSVGMESEYDAIFYSGKTKGNGIAVDPEQGIYESKFATEFMKKLMAEIRKEKIPVASLIGKFQVGEITNNFYVPSFIGDELLETIFRVAAATGTKGLRITAFLELTPKDF